MTSYTNVFGGSVIQTSERSLNEVVLDADKELVWLTQFQDSSLVVAMIVDVTGQDQDDRILTLPDATLTSVGQSILINNIGNHRFILNRNDGTTLVNDFATAESRFFYLHDNTVGAIPSSRGGDWRQGLNNGNISVTSVGLDVPDLNDASNVVITNSPITANGDIHLALGSDLLALVGFGNNTGIAVRTVGGANPVWKMGTISGTDRQITVSAIDINGNLVISLPPSIGDGNVNDITLGAGQQLKLIGNTSTIESVGGNVNLNLLASGTGSVVVKGEDGNTRSLNFEHIDAGNSYYNSFKAGDLTGPLRTLSWPATDPVEGQIMRIGADNISLEWSTAPIVPGLTLVNTVPRYIGPTGQLGSSGVEINDTDDMSKVRSISISTNTLINGLFIGGASADTIASYNNGDIKLHPNGTGMAISSGIAFAWVSCTVSVGGVATIVSSFNVNGPITFNSTGNYTINFSRPFNNINYVCVASLFDFNGASTAANATMHRTGVVSAAYAIIITTAGDGITLVEPSGFSAVFYQL